MMADLSRNLVQIVLWMTPLIVVLLFLRPWLRRWIGGRGMALIWALITLRLLVPFVWTVPEEWSVEVREVVERKGAVMAGTYGEVQPRTPEMERSGFPLTPQALLVGAWLVGSGVMLGWLLLGAARLWRLRTEEVTELEALAAWVGIDARLKGRVRLRTCARLTSPALVGRSIWLPKGWQLTEGQWRHILLHELGHYRRGDLWQQWLGQLTLAFYWWNPAVWLMTRAASVDREIACDEWVRRKWADVEEYGATLITIARWMKGGSLPGAVLMATGKRQLEQRVEEMARGRVQPLWSGAVLGSAVLLLALGLTAGAAEKKKFWPWQEGWNSPEFRRDYLKKNEVDYQKVKSWGAVELQWRYFELTKADAPRLLSGILGRELTPTEIDTAMIPLTPEAAEKALRVVGNSPFTTPYILHPYSALSPTPNLLGPKMRIEVMRELKYATEFSPEGVPTSVASELLGIGLEVEWKKEGSVYELGLQGYVSEVLGFYHFRARENRYRSVPWKESLHDRGDFTPPPMDEALPIILRRQAIGSVYLSEGEVVYVLLRSMRESSMVAHTGPADKEIAALSPKPPALDREYWFLLRLRAIPAEDFRDQAE